MNTTAVFSLVATLSGVGRFSRIPMTRRENVLEHTATVNILCVVIGNHVNKLVPRTIDMGKLLECATLHDWDESITGDVTRPVKYFSPQMREEFKHVEERGIIDIADMLRLPHIVGMHANAKFNDAEGFVLTIADVAAAVMRVWDEVLCHGNCHMIGPARGMRGVVAKHMQRIDEVPAATHELFYGISNELLSILNKAIDKGNANMIVEFS